MPCCSIFFHTAVDEDFYRMTYELDDIIRLKYCKIDFYKEMTTKQQIDNIEQKIKKHEYDFFVLGEETLSRPEMEMLKVELYHLKKILEEEEKEKQNQSVSNTGDSLFEFYDGI